ncbi:MAG TPA: hypothetical protein VN258_07515 [Mobilitalea sp.]|nr:hypothetical protein [Mobilitalea sp.]
MAIIKSVEVKGFKSHLESKFEYAPGLTVVTGPSDTGKSAGVMQPIKWVAFGEPAGEDFLFTIRDEETPEIIRQAEQAEVIITTDVAVVKKVRRKGKTAWYINDMENPISEKADVPDEVKAILGLEIQTYGEFETSLNFAYQLEAPFIISETPSVGAKVLGKLAGTEVVDKAIGTIGKKVYKARDDRANAQKAIDRTNVELIEYLQLDDLNKTVADAEALILVIDRDADTAAHIRQLYQRYEVVGEHLGEIQEKLKLLIAIPELKTLISDIDVDMQAADVLYPAFIKYNDLEDQISKVRFRIKQLEDLPAISDIIEEITTAYKAHTDVFRLISEYSGIESRIQGKMAALDSLIGIKAASELLAETDLDYERGNNISRLRYAWTCQSEYITAAEKSLEACKQIPEAVALLAQVDEDYKRLDILRTIYADFQKKEQSVNTATCDVGLKASEFKAAEEELAALWVETGGSCPLCGQELSASHLH